MGSFVSKQVNDLLSQFTFNFEQDQFNLNIFKGQASIDNLLLNHIKINQILNSKNVPINLQFGLLKRFDIKVSYMSKRIESIIIDSLILILRDTDN